MSDLALLDPAEYYENELKEKINEHSEQFFDEFVSNSKINIHANRKKVAEYNQTLNESKKIKRRKKFLKFLKIVIFILFVLTSFICYSDNIEPKIYLNNIDVYYAFAGEIFFFIIFSIRQAKLTKKNNLLESKADQLQREAYHQTHCLNELICAENFIKVAESVLPSLKVFNYIPSALIKKLKEKSKENNDSFDMLNLMKSDDYTISGVVSGTIDGKMFMSFSYDIFYMGEKTYSGSATYSYTDYETDQDGHEHAVTRYETLYASTTKPYPYYYTRHKNIYYSEACPNLYFLRQPIGVREKTEQKINREINKKSKKLIREEKKAMKKGENFTGMSDVEFETLFNCETRNNEVEFRMMYTPLAIANFKSLVKYPDGFSDIFILEKDGCLTSSLLGPKNIPYSRFRPVVYDMLSYSYDQIHKDFINGSVTFFKDLFFGLAPMFMIPIYSQGENFVFSNSNLNSIDYHFFDAESLVNHNVQLFRPDSTVTNVISKAKLLKKYSYGGLFTITSSSFAAYNRVEHVYVSGAHVSGDVPINWTEYIGYTSEKYIFLRYIGLPDLQVIEEMHQYQDKYYIDYIYNDGFLGIVFNSISDFNDNDFLEEIFNNLTSKKGDNKNGKSIG